MSRETIKNLVELIPEQDIETIYRVIVRFIPEDEALPDEIESIKNNDADKETYSDSDIDWD